MMAEVFKTTPYSVLFDAALSKLKDYDFDDLSQDEIYIILLPYIRPACVKFKASVQNLKNRDDMLQQFNLVLEDDEIEILANEVVRAYIDATYLKTPLVLKTMLTSKDFHVFSNANHIRSLMLLDETLKKENEQLISGYSWENSSIYDSGSTTL